MKTTTFRLILLLVLVFAAGCVIYIPSGYDEPAPPEEEYYERPSGRDISYFYDYLSPYGVWVHHRPHGYVWIPRMDDYGWRPYTRGQWVWTDHGWTWFSRLRWGWATFHYGRWGWDRSLGWYWSPGTVWGPAWVTWRRGLNYIGWAPIPPQVRFVRGVGIVSLPFDLDIEYWIFVVDRNFYGNDVHPYVLPFERKRSIIGYSTVRTNIVTRNNLIINQGYDVNTISRVTRRTVLKYELDERDRPDNLRMGTGRIEVYKPRIRENDRAVPRRVVERSRVQESLERFPASSRSRSPEKEKAEIEERHDREMRVVERTQNRDIQELKRRKQEESRRTRNEAQRKKVEKEYTEKATRMKASHEKEKTAVKKRHDQERKKVEKKKIKK